MYPDIPPETVEKYKGDRYSLRVVISDAKELEKLNSKLIQANNYMENPFEDENTPVKIGNDEIYPETLPIYISNLQILMKAKQRKLGIIIPTQAPQAEVRTDPWGARSSRFPYNGQTNPNDPLEFFTP